MRRSTVFKATGAALAGASALASGLRVAAGHDLRPVDPTYRFDEYERIANRHAAIKQLYQWPNLDNAIVFANIRNGLNGAQFSYGLPADQVQVIVQTYASANAATYDDHIWAKYRIGDAFNVKEPATGRPSTRNQWWASTVPAPETAPAERDHAFYADMSIEGLHRRGVLFLT